MLLAGFVAFSAAAQPELENVNAPIYSIDGRGTAVGGFDAVGYFDYGEATMGDPEIYYDVEGTYRFRFASKINQRKFMGNPDRYIPAFGGYCALSLGLDEKEMPGRKPGLYRGEPTIYKVLDDRVYLFHSESALERWNENEVAYRARAEANWDAFLSAKKK